MRQLAVVLTWWLAASFASAEDLKLSVDWNGVKTDQPFPVTGGVPLARAALKDPAAVRLIGPSGQVPLQTEVLAWWPDKSVKWLLLDFPATPGESDFTLQYGPGVKSAAAPPGIVAEAIAGAVSVDTGAVKFLVRPDGSGFIDELSFRGNKLPDSTGRRLNLMDAVRTASPADYHPMDRYVRDGQADPSRVEVAAVTLEKAGPLHAVVRIDGKYRYQKVGSTITGTDVKGDCPFRVRIHAYAGQSLLRVEHFFYYEGDGDHDFVKSLALKVPLPAGAGGIRFIGADRTIQPAGPIAGLHQQTCDSFEVWNCDGKTLSVGDRGGRFEGVLDVTAGAVGLAVGVRDFWQNHAKSLRADLKAGELGIYLWPPESCPLDFRRHAREWSVGETGEPDDKDANTPAPFARENYRLASKGVGKTHYAMVYPHDPAAKPEQLLAVYRLFDHRPILWAPPRHYAASLALGRYRERVPGEHDDVEAALDQPVRFWRFSQERFRWYGFWTYGNVCQSINQFIQNGRWEQDFGRWGWANGDSVGRLAYALMLQSVRKCERADLEFAEKYLYNVHDVCSIHSPATTEHYGDFAYFKGAAHRHGAWPWACPYTGIRGAHPVGAKIYYFLTGEGHVKDVLEEITQLALRRPDGGMGDGPLGPNAQIFLYQWEATGKDEWRDRVRKEIENSDMKKANSGWTVMMHAAFGIYNALEEYMDLTGDQSMRGLVADFADKAMPEKMKKDWTWGGYFRVYAAAYNITRDEKYRKAIEEMLPVLLERAAQSVAAKLPEKDWPGPAGGPQVFVDGNIIRDIPFALYTLHAGEAPKGGK